MPKTLRPRRYRGPVALSAALALLASACGGTSTETSGDDVPADSSSTDSTAEAPAEAPADSEESSDDAADEDAAEEAPAESEESSDDAADEDAAEEAPAEDEAPAQNLFPDLEVTNIVDGSSVNLAAELGGGDVPVLLWFWAPH